MNREMTQPKDAVYQIESMMSMFRCEDKDMLLNRIESLLYSLPADQVQDLYEGLSEDYPEMFPESYNESENTNDFFENGDPDDCDPAGGYGLNSHI